MRSTVARNPLLAIPQIVGSKFILILYFSIKKVKDEYHIKIRDSANFYF
jgi:hypothetical protein